MLGGLVYKETVGREYVLTHITNRSPDTQCYALKAATQTVPCDDIRMHAAIADKFRLLFVCIMYVKHIFTVTTTD